MTPLPVFLRLHRDGPRAGRHPRASREHRAAPKNRTRELDSGQNDPASRSKAPALRCAAALAVALLTLARPADAAPIGSFSASLSGLYGNNWSGDVQYDPYGLGVGLHAGFVLPASIYIGGALKHFFGQKVGESLFSVPSIDIERTSSLTELTGHLGYELDSAAATLRPSLGFGYALTSIEVQSTREGVETSSASTEGAFVLSPGVEARIPIGAVAGCIELRYEALLGADDDPSALVIGVGVGLDL